MQFQILGVLFGLSVQCVPLHFLRNGLGLNFRNDVQPPLLEITYFLITRIRQLMQVFHSKTKIEPVVSPETSSTMKIICLPLFLLPTLISN